MLRSPTAAFVLAQEPYNYNTRAAGISDEYALVEVDDVLLTWADEIVCMSAEQQDKLEDMCGNLDLDTKVICLNIPDSFGYRDPQLIMLIKEKYNEL